MKKENNQDGIALNSAEHPINTPLSIDCHLDDLYEEIPKETYKKLIDKIMFMFKKYEKQLSDKYLDILKTKKCKCGLECYNKKEESWNINS